MTDPDPETPARRRAERAASTASSSTRPSLSATGDGEGDAVTSPAKVMRIGSMVKLLLEEVRAAPLDEPSRERLARSTSDRSPSCPRRCRPTCSTS